MVRENSTMLAFQTRYWWHCDNWKNCGLCRIQTVGLILLDGLCDGCFLGGEFCSFQCDLPCDYSCAMLLEAFLVPLLFHLHSFGFFEMVSCSSCICSHLLYGDLVCIWHGRGVGVICLSNLFFLEAPVFVIGVGWPLCCKMFCWHLWVEVSDSSCLYFCSSVASCQSHLSHSLQINFLSCS